MLSTVTPGYDSSNRVRSAMSVDSSSRLGEFTSDERYSSTRMLTAKITKSPSNAIGWKSPTNSPIATVNNAAAARPIAIVFPWDRIQEV